MTSLKITEKETNRPQLLDPENSQEQIIADKILWVLHNFPTISPSMLQISLGSGIPTAVWQPVLEKLVTQKQVYRYVKSVANAKGRKSSQTFISSSPDPDDVVTEK